MALILGLMTRENKSLGTLAGETPVFNIHKDKILMDRGSLDTWYKKVEKTFPDGNIDHTDGLRISWKEKWIHLRPSNTEPIVRVIAEAPTMEEAIELSGTCKRLAP
jgi:phosphomannomutase